ncbi:MAG: hypothetical protein WAM07_07905 [Halobacillus sp.]|uniref:hypothetical protein n=1 Tax=Halobacillus sp. TaxID=56800 RepID=UPI003BB1A066
MTKHVEAYFRTENDAESAKSSLQKYNIEQEAVEPIPEEVDLTPIVPASGSANTGGGTFNFTDVITPNKDKDAMADKRHLTHVLNFKIPEENYDEALKVIVEHDGHMEQSKL